MGVINVDDIVGLRFKNEIVWLDCATEEEYGEATGEEIITRNEVEADDIYFCDRCGKRLTGK